MPTPSSSRSMTWRFVRWALLLLSGVALGWLGSRAWHHQPTLRAGAKLLFARPSEALTHASLAQSGSQNKTLTLGGQSFDIAQIIESGTIENQLRELMALANSASETELCAFSERAFASLVALQPEQIGKLLLFAQGHVAEFEALGELLWKRLTNPELKSRLDFTMRRLIAADTDRALLLLDVFPQEGQREFRQQIYQALALKNPDAALSMALGMEEGKERQALLREAFMSLAALDPQQAAARFETFKSDPNYVDVIEGLSASWAKTDPEALLEWAEKMEPGYNRKQAIETAIEHLDVKSLDRLIEKRLGEPSSGQQYSTRDAITNLMGQDPARGLKRLGQVTSEELTEALTNPTYLESFLYVLFRANDTHQVSSKAILALPDGKIKEALLPEFLMSYSRLYENTAKHWIQDLSLEDREMITPYLTKPGRELLALRLGQEHLLSPEALERGRVQLNAISPMEKSKRSDHLNLLNPEEAAAEVSAQWQHDPVSAAKYEDDIMTVVASLSNLDLEKARNWLATLPASPSRDNATLDFMNYDRSPLHKDALLSLISDPVIKRRAEKDLAAEANF